MITNQQQRQFFSPEDLQTALIPASGEEHTRSITADAGLTMVTITGQNLVIEKPLPSIASLSYYDTATSSYKTVPDPASNPTGFKSMFGTAPGGLNNSFEYKPVFNEEFTKEDAVNYAFITIIKCRVRETSSYVMERYYTFTSSAWTSGDNYGWSVTDPLPVNTASVESMEVFSIQFCKLTRLLMTYVPF